MSFYGIYEGGALISVFEASSSADCPPGAVFLSDWPGWATGRSAAQAWADVRDKRDRLLAGTDWITVRALEQGQAVPTAWATYRQALRDITGHSDPFNITWPNAPIGT